jgi:hypothetical protein
MMQEFPCKDVEKAFGVLQARFVIIWNLSKHWNIATIDDIMIMCVILHNVIVEDESDTCLENLFEPRNVLDLK